MGGLGTRVGAVLALIMGLSVGLGAGASAVSSDGAQVVGDRGPSIGWNGYRGVRMRTRLDAAARRLGGETSTSPCYVGRLLVDGRGERTVTLFTTTRRDGRVNQVQTAGTGVRGPAGVRNGMRADAAERSLGRAGHGTTRHRTRNPAYGTWVHDMTAAGPRGRVLSLRLYRGRVVSMSLFAGRALEREYRGVLLSC